MTEEGQAGEDGEVEATAALDLRAHALLEAAHGRGSQDIFAPLDGSDAASGADDLSVRKQAADRLVALRLAKYADEGRTQVSLTNAGRYWALNGGYMAFLKEEPPSGGGGRGRNPELEALRFTYMKLRLNTFWWSFGLSIASFIISITSIMIALFYGERLLR
jgi:hypothetical protein